MPTFIDGAVEVFPGFKLGADPECFIIDAKGLPVAANLFVPGTKETPHKVPGGALQVDGVAAEVNIDPAESFVEFRDNLNLVIGALQATIPKDHRLAWVPSIQFPADRWETIPEQAKELGCHPDMNAWTEEFNPPPEISPEYERLRTAAGHIHIGWGEGLLADPAHKKNCFDLVKQLDWHFFGVVPRAEEALRRQMYGRAGACRIKDYGVEYRVPSASWVSGVVPWSRIWNAVNLAIYQMSRAYAPDLFKFDNETVQYAINYGVYDEDLMETYSMMAYTDFGDM
jgi:hypothetical protein